MAIQSISATIAGLEFSPVPHLLVQDNYVVGATSSCVKLFKCDDQNEICNSLIKEWIVDYDPNMPVSAIAEMQTKKGDFFQALIVRRDFSLRDKNVEVISINRLSDSQMQKTAEDLNLLSHVLNPPMTQLNDFLDNPGDRDLEGHVVPRLRRMSFDLTDGITKFRFYKILENRTIASQPVRFNPKDLLLQIIETKTAIHTGKWEININLPINMENVLLDEEKLKFIINEILQNVITHNLGGKIVLTAKEEHFQGSKSLVITIQDNGKGFVWPERSSEPSSGSPVRRSLSGGVGLSICAAFIKAMEGDLQIDSVEGEGTTVRLTFPCNMTSGASGEKLEMNKADYKMITRERSLSDPVHNSPKMVPIDTKPSVSAIQSPRSVGEKTGSATFKYHALVVEDNLVNSKILVRLLEGFGLTCDVAENGLEAVDKMRANPKTYHLIFMDLLMPKMNGLEATEIIQQICKDEKNPVPIFACTANMEDDQKCLDANMAGVIHKPVKKDALLKALIWVAESNSVK